MASEYKKTLNKISKELRGHRNRFMKENNVSPVTISRVLRGKSINHSLVESLIEFLKKVKSENAKKEKEISKQLTDILGE